MTNEITVQSRDNHAWVTSREIAIRFNKRHADVLRAIDNLLRDNPNAGVRRGFTPIEMPDENGQLRRAFEVNRDGFAFLAVSFHGKGAMEIKIKIIAALNEGPRQQSLALAMPDEERILAWLADDGAKTRKLVDDNKAAVLHYMKNLRQRLDVVEALVDTSVKGERHVYSQNKRILRGILHSGAVDPEAFNADLYVDLPGVYERARISMASILRRGILSQQIRWSLISFFTRSRHGADFRYDFREVFGKTIWLAEGVDAWLKECGREIIMAHFRRHGSAPGSVIDFPKSVDGK